MNITDACTETVCEALPECTVCHLRKPPRGRSVAAEIATGMCSSGDCPGFLQEPRSGHLWPGELRREQERRDEEQS